MPGFQIMIQIQWGLEYRTLEYQTHWNTECFEVQISNGLVLEWSVIAKHIAMVPTIPKPNRRKSKQNGVHFVPIYNGLGENGSPLEFRTPLYWTSLLFKSHLLYIKLVLKIVKLARSIKLAKLHFQVTDRWSNGPKLRCYPLTGLKVWYSNIFMYWLMHNCLNTELKVRRLVFRASLYCFPQWLFDLGLEFFLV